MDSHTFCQRLGPAIRLPVAKDEAYRAAMLRRAERSEKITGKMVGAINVRQPVLGMNLCAVIAAFGQPHHSNHSVTQYSDSFQLVYERPRMYLYLEAKQGDYYLIGIQD